MQRVEQIRSASRDNYPEIYRQDKNYYPMGKEKYWTITSS